MRDLSPNSYRLPAALRVRLDQLCDPNAPRLDSAERKSLLHALNAFLGQNRSYPNDLAAQLERYRNCLDGSLVHDVLRPRVVFSIIVRRLQLVDPDNGTFSLHCEASVGAPIDHALAYLAKDGIASERLERLKQTSLGGVIWLDDERIATRLSSLLRVRVLSGEIQHWYEYYRFGTTSGHLWLIQSFTVKVHQAADFRNLPFDKFVFAVDFSVGMGGDVANVDLCIDETHTGNPSTLLAPDFNAGEFRFDPQGATLTPLGFLQDPSCYFETVARLQLLLRRSGTPLLLRIVLPQLLMIFMVVAASWVIRDVTAMVTQLLPTIFLATVALQLTASQRMPRGAPFSRMDRLFLLSYVVIFTLFAQFSACGPPQSWLILAIAAVYAVGAVLALKPRRNASGVTTDYEPEGISAPTAAQPLAADAARCAHCDRGGSVRPPVLNDATPR
jgi:hypothetical protein